MSINFLVLFYFVWCMVFSMMVSALPPEQLSPALDALCIPILTPLQVNSFKLQRNVFCKSWMTFASFYFWSLGYCLLVIPDMKFSCSLIAYLLFCIQQLVTAAQQAGSSQQFSSNQYTVYIDRIANIFRCFSTHSVICFYVFVEPHSITLDFSL